MEHARDPVAAASFPPMLRSGLWRCDIRDGRGSHVALWVFDQPERFLFVVARHVSTFCVQSGPQMHSGASM